MNPFSTIVMASKDDFQTLRVLPKPTFRVLQGCHSKDPTFIEPIRLQ